MVTASWNDAAPASHAAPADPGPRSVVVSRGDERIALAPGQFDPFEADMPSTNSAPLAAPAPATTPAYDPFEDPATEQAPRELNSIPAPSLEEAFEEPAADEAPVAPQAPAAEEEAVEVDELETAKQAIDRELMRRDQERGQERGLADELVAPEATPKEAPPVVEQEQEMAAEIVAPSLPEATEESVVEEQEEYEYQLPEDDRDAELQYGGRGEPLPLPTPEQLERRRQEMERERLKSLEECEELYEAVRADSIKSISLDIRLRGEPGEDFPFQCEGHRPAFQPRSWAPVAYQWKASGLCHKPLYFEQAQLERYGHDWGPVLQPFVSGAHFFGSAAILPYKMGLQTPNECDYALGYYRPGNCAPYMIEPLGFTWRAAAFQAGAVTGAAFVIP